MRDERPISRDADVISQETPLHIYEIEGDIRDHLNTHPQSFMGVWNEDDLSYVFFTESEDDYICQCLNSCNLSFREKHITLYSEWQHPLPFGGFLVGNLMFVPDDNPSPPKGALRFDPSVAFGDGSHPTTAACLEFMSGLIPTVPVLSMLDLGTGTGILSLAAAALGVKRIVAVEKNDLALRTAEKNIGLNNLDFGIALKEGDARMYINDFYDLAVANLPFEVLFEIAGFEETANIDHWIISGISEAQGLILENSFSKYGFRKMLFREDFPWVSFVMSSSK